MSESLIAEVDGRTPHAVELAVLCSIAVVIKPELLRRIRLAATPRLDVGAEADLWLSDLIGARNAAGFAFEPDVAEALRERLRRRYHSGERAAVERAWAEIVRRHELDILSPALALEERIAWMHVTGEPIWAIEAELHRALATPGEGVEWWAAQAWRRLPERVRRTDAGFSLRRLAARTEYDQTLALREGESTDDLADRLRHLRQTRLGVRRRGSSVEVGAISTGHAIELPDTEPRIVTVRWDDGEPAETLAVRPGEVRRVDVGAGAIHLETLTGERYVLPRRRSARRDLIAISHQWPQRELARRLADVLSERVGDRADIWVADEDGPMSDRRRATADRATVAVLLLSSEYLSSQFLLHEEVPALVGAGAQIIPVVAAQLPASHIPPYLNTDAVLAQTRPLNVADDDVWSELCDVIVSRLRPQAAALGRLRDVPKLPSVYLSSPEFVEIRSRLLEGESVTLVGPPGAGKTVLAAALARDRTVRERFTDGIVWLRPAELPPRRDTSAGPRLIIVDGIDEGRHRNIADEQLLVTERVGHDREAAFFELRPWPEKDARWLLAKAAGIDQLPFDADSALRVETRPGFLVLAARALREGRPSWERLERLLRAAGREGPLQYDTLTAMHEPPDRAVWRLWSHLSALTEAETRQLLREFEAIGLLSRSRPWNVVPVFGDPLERREERHAHVISAYREVVPRGGTWRDLPLDEPYIWANLLGHLRDAGHKRELAATAKDVAFLAAATFASEWSLVAHQLRSAAEALPEDQTVSWVYDRFYDLGIPPTPEELPAIASTLRELMEPDAPRDMDFTGLAVLEADWSQLSPQQAQVRPHLIAMLRPDGPRVLILDGPRGSGKTETVRFLRRVLEAAGERVVSSDSGFLPADRGTRTWVVRDDYASAGAPEFRRTSAERVADSDQLRLILVSSGGKPPVPLGPHVVRLQLTRARGDT